MPRSAPERRIAGNCPCVLTLGDGTVAFLEQPPDPSREPKGEPEPAAAPHGKRIGALVGPSQPQPVEGRVGHAKCRSCKTGPTGRNDDMGMILIGMPGFDRQLARYPQLYSRIGFAHQYRPLDPEDIPDVLEHYWQQLGLPFDPPTRRSGERRHPDHRRQLPAHRTTHDPDRPHPGDQPAGHHHPGSRRRRPTDPRRRRPVRPNKSTTPRGPCIARRIGSGHGPAAGPTFKTSPVLRRSSTRSTRAPKNCNNERQPSLPRRPSDEPCNVEADEFLAPCSVRP